MKFTRIIFLLILLGMKAGKGFAQNGSCPSNIDFESGNFDGWVCSIGSVIDVNGVNIVTMSTTDPQENHHTIISGNELDPIGHFPQRCPNGSGYSVKLGSTEAGAVAEGISYTYTIPSNVNNFSLLINYAVVLQDGGHPVAEQPRFRAKVIDALTDLPLSCVDFDFTASSSLPGFIKAEGTDVPENVFYKEWTPVTINLSGYAGKTIRLEFINSDCTHVAHFAYAYVDVSSSCNGALTGNTSCGSNDAITLMAPSGFEFYEWYSDNSFSTIISHYPFLTLYPPPANGTVYPVIVKPYPGFGCIDTLLANIVRAEKPVSVAGADATICQYKTVQLGAPAVPGLAYSWTPANLVNDPHSANPLAHADPGTPVKFVLQTTDLANGCFSLDTAIITSLPVDSAVRISGPLSYCEGQGSLPTFAINSSSANVQWFANGLPLTGVNTISYQPPGSGTYWAQFTQGTCTDTTMHLVMAIRPIPVVSFLAKDTGCLFNNSMTFTNTSSIQDGSALGYRWTFGDGNTSTSKDGVNAYLQSGTFDVELLATSIFGCSKTELKTVHIIHGASAAFTWDSVCVERPVIFHNQTDEHGAQEVTYNWDFGNNSIPVNVKDPPPAVYTSEGLASVTLKASTTGCEDNPSSVTHIISINKPLPGVKLTDITVPQGYTSTLRARGIGIVYSWNPVTNLTSYNNRYAQFTAVADTRYLINITDRHSCSIVDTLNVLVLKKPGFYMPNSFTPNNDGVNDLIRPYMLGMKQFLDFSVYDRYGNCVFKTAVSGEGWNGRYKNEASPAGVYVWMFRYVSSENREVLEKGTVNLLR